MFRKFCSFTEKAHLHFSRFQSEWDLNTVAAILSQLAGRFTTREQIQKLNSFVENNKSKHGSWALISRGIGNAEYNLNWADKHMPEIIAYLKGPGPGSDGARPRASLLMLALVSFVYYLLLQ